MEKQQSSQIIKRNNLSNQQIKKSENYPQNISFNKDNQILKKSLKLVMKILIKQFKERTFSFNQASRQYRMKLNQMDQNNKEVIQVQNMSSQIDIVIWQLVSAPKHWVLMLKNQQIHAQQQQFIDLYSFTSRIFKKITIQGKKTSPYFVPLCQLITEPIFVFLEEISVIICQYYNFGRKLLIEQIDDLNTTLEKSTILNVYTLYKILRDISLLCKKRISQYIRQGLFIHLDIEIADYFAYYVIEKFEVLQMKIQNQQTKKRKLDITERIQMSKKVSWRQAVNDQGQQGIFLQIQKQQNQKGEKQKDNYVIKFDQQGQMRVMNCNSLTKNWKVKKEAQQNYNIIKMVQNKKALAQKLRNTQVATNPKQLTAIDHFSTIGGSLGKCLANIDKYDSVGTFVTDVSKKAVIGGSFSYMLATVPIMSYVFIAGGFSYSFYYIFSNNKNNMKKKFQQVGKVGIDTVSSLGSGLLGAFVGQSLIPIPVLGAFIGGIVGGLVGQIGGKAISNFIQSARFKGMIKQLLMNIKPNGSWQPNKSNLSIIGLNKQFFYQSIPQYLQKKMGCDKTWFTLICFTLLTFYESKKRAKFMKKKIEQLKDQKTILDEDDVVDSQQYQTSIDLMCVMHFLQQEEVEYMKLMHNLQEIISDMFTRLK